MGQGYQNSGLARHQSHQSNNNEYNQIAGDETEEEDFKEEKPEMDAKLVNEVNKNIKEAMTAAQTISKDIDSPQELDAGTLEMILFLTQKSISDLKELHQRNKYSPSYSDSQLGTFQNSPDYKIQQVKQLASNAYELINTLESMKKSKTQKEHSLSKQSRQYRDTVKSILDSYHRNHESANLGRSSNYSSSTRDRHRKSGREIDW